MEAMITPMTMKETFPRVLSDGGATPSAQDARRTAKGVVACGLSDLRCVWVAMYYTFSIWMNATLK
jgi:hypothetical protein